MGNLCMVLSHFQVLKGDREFDSVQLFQLENEKILSEQRSLHERVRRVCSPEKGHLRLRLK